MATIDKEFHALCNNILENGREYTDERRGVKRLQIPSYTFRHSFADGFPAITNKKLYWKGIVTELIWFLRGDHNIEYLNKHGVTIWNDDAYNWYKREVARLAHVTPMTFEEFSAIGKGSVGHNYSVQWRNFNGNTDQIKNLIKDMKENIMGSRLKVNAWNPSEVNLTALPPCHSEFQVVGVPLTLQERLNLFSAPGNTYPRAEDDDDNTIPTRGSKNDTDHFLRSILDEAGVPQFGFELHWNQRSCDVFLGIPFNIASYGLLAKKLELFTGFPALAIEGTLKCVHFYDNQYEAAKELVSRRWDTHPNCDISMPLIEDMSRSLDDILASFSPEDFKLIGYASDAAIKVKMLAPTKI